MTAVKPGLRFLLSYLLANLLILTGTVRRAKRKALREECILSIYMHDPSKKEFESCIEWLLSNQFNPLSLTDLETIAAGRRAFPKGGVIITVDDGWHSNEKNIVEVAKRYKVPVAIFVATEPVEEGCYWWSYIDNPQKKNALKQVENATRVAVINELMKNIELSREAMTIDQVRRIAKCENVIIGSHTHTHPILPNCTADQVWEELDLSRTKLEKWIEKKVQYFAYPNGSYSDRETGVLKNLGYKLAFSTLPEYITPATISRRTFELPRFEVLENASRAENICRMVGVWQPFANRLKKITSTFI